MPTEATDIVKKPLKECRDKRFLEIELRAAEPENAESRTVIGHAAVFNTWAQIGWWFRERIMPGAFTAALTRSDIRALLNHDPNFLLARTTSGTLKVTEDDKGLAIEFDLPQSRQDVFESIKRKDLTQMSFAFTIKTEQWEYNTSDDMDERTIIEFDEIFDVSLVTYPAYEDTDVDLRSHEGFKEKRKAEEQSTEENTEESEDTKDSEDATPALERARRILSKIKIETEL
jgi:HK97 family phage prohead protease